MIFLGWLLLVLLPVLGFALARALWPAPRRWSSADPLRLAAAPLLGAGAASCVYFALRLVLHLPPAASLAGFMILTALAAGRAWQVSAAAPEDPAIPDAPAPRWLTVLLGLGLFLVIATFLLIGATAPHGGWDAFAIWNLRARALFRAVEFAGPFSPLLDWTHPDYPLLLPGTLALLWHGAGAETPTLGAGLHLLLLLSAIGVPYAALRLLRGSGMAAVAGLVLCGATTFIRESASQYADVPLAAALVAAAAFAAVRLTHPATGIGPMLLAGLAAGCAAWTKNEGLLLCGTFLVAYAAVALWRQRAALPGLLPAAAGALSILAFVGHFKYHMAPANDLINAGSASQMSQKGALFDRISTIFGAFLSEFLVVGGILVPATLLFVAWLVLVKPRPDFGAAEWFPWLLTTLQLAGYVAVYSIAPGDIDWRLASSAGRLLLHVWPLGVFGIFLISRDIFPSSPQLSRPGKRSK